MRQIIPTNGIIVHKRKGEHGYTGKQHVCEGFMDCVQNDDDDATI